MGPTPNTATLLDLVAQTERRTLRTDEKRLLREGIQALEAQRASAGGLRRALDTADRDRTILAATFRRIQQLAQQWQETRPTTATVNAAIDALTDALRPALNSVETP